MLSVGIYVNDRNGRDRKKDKNEEKLNRSEEKKTEDKKQQQPVI